MSLFSRQIPIVCTGSSSCGGQRGLFFRQREKHRRTSPSGQDVRSLCRGGYAAHLLPEGGYSAAREGEFTVEESAQDVYLLLCGGDYRKLRALYVQLTGRCALVRLSTLGAWNSKYFKYDEESAKQVILDYENTIFRSTTWCSTPIGARRPTAASDMMSIRGCFPT